MTQLWEIVGGAPWWVYVLLVILVKIGIQSTKPRTIPFQRLLLLPVVFVLWSIYRLYLNVSLGYPSLILWWTLSILLGAYLGVLEVRKWKIHIDKAKKTITIPGNYSTIILIVAIFILNFFWSYLYSTLTAIPYWIHAAGTITTTIVNGFFVGRGGFFLKSYIKSNKN